jgi:hypothetical protein
MQAEEGYRQLYQTQLARCVKAILASFYVRTILKYYYAKRNLSNETLSSNYISTYNQVEKYKNYYVLILSLRGVR